MTKVVEMSAYLIYAPRGLAGSNGGQGWVPITLALAQTPAAALALQAQPQGKRAILASECEPLDVVAVCALAQTVALMQLQAVAAQLVQVAGVWHADHEAQKITGPRRM